VATSSDLRSVLTAIYGDDAVRQLSRYQSAMAAFAAYYGPGPVTLFRAPGRVNLIGEHTDYHHGFVLPVSLDRDVLLLARPRTDTTVKLINIERAKVRGRVRLLKAVR